MTQPPAPRASNPFALAALVAANLLPIAGVLFWDWRVFDLLLLYWIENAVVGVFTILKILVASRSDSPPALTILEKVFLVPFFTFHYGLFWLVHGVFVYLLFSGQGPSQGLDGAVQGLSRMLDGPGRLMGFGFLSGPIAASLGRLDAYAWPALGLLLSHGVSFFSNFIGQGEFRRVTPREAMGHPYGRVVVLHLVIIGGGFLAVAAGQSLPVLLLFVGLKIWVDLQAHLREHRRDRQAEA